MVKKVVEGSYRGWSLVKFKEEYGYWKKYGKKGDYNNNYNNNRRRNQKVNRNGLSPVLAGKFFFVIVFQYVMCIK